MVVLLLFVWHCLVSFVVVGSLLSSVVWRCSMHVVVVFCCCCRRCVPLIGVAVAVFVGDSVVVVVVLIVGGRVAVA